MNKAIPKVIDKLIVTEVSMETGEVKHMKRTYIKN